MEERLDDFIWEMSYYYDGDTDAFQVATIESIKDKELCDVLTKDGLGKDTLIIVYSGTMRIKNEKFNEDKKHLSASAIINKSKMLKKALPFKEYKIFTIKQEEYDQLVLDENHNVSLRNKNNKKILEAVYNREPKIVSLDIARKINLKNVQPIPYLLQKSLIETIAVNMGLYNAQSKQDYMFWKNDLDKSKEDLYLHNQKAYKLQKEKEHGCIEFKDSSEEYSL